MKLESKLIPEQYIYTIELTGNERFLFERWLAPRVSRDSEDAANRLAHALWLAL